MKNSWPKRGVRIHCLYSDLHRWKETGRVEKIKNNQTIPVVDEIVEVGTKKVASTTTNGNKNDTATLNMESKLESAKKEETVSQDKKVLTKHRYSFTSLFNDWFIYKSV